MELFEKAGLMLGALMSVEVSADNADFLVYRWSRNIVFVRLKANVKKDKKESDDKVFSQKLLKVFCQNIICFVYVAHYET